METMRNTIQSKKGKLILGGLAFLMLLGLGASAVAKRMHRHGWLMKRIAKKLDLSQDQKARLRIIFKNARKDVMQNKAQMKGIKDSLKKLMAEENPSKTKLDELVAKGFDTAKKIALSKTTYLLQARDVLTPVQRTKIKNFMKRIKKFRKKRGRKFNKMWNDPNFVPSFLK